MAFVKHPGHRLLDGLDVVSVAQSAGDLHIVKTGCSTVEHTYIAVE